MQSNAEAVIVAPRPLVAQVQSTQPAVVTLVNGMAEDVLAATIVNISTALDSSVNLPYLVAQLGVAEVALSSLPSVQPVAVAFAQLQSSTTALTTNLTTTLANLTTTLTTPTTTLAQLVANLTTALTTFTTLAPQLTTALPAAQSNTTSLLSYQQILYNPSTESGYIEYVLQNLFQYTNIPSVANLQPVVRSMQLVLGLGSGQPLNATEASALFSGLLQLYATLSNLPPWDAAATEMVTINTYMNLSVVNGQPMNAAANLNTSDRIISQLLPLLSSIQTQYTQLLPYINSTLPINASLQLLSSMQAALTQLPSVSQLQSALSVMPTLQSVIAQIHDTLQPLDVLTSQFLSLPSSALLLSYDAELNSTVPAAQQQFANTLAQLQSLLSTTTTVNTSSDVAAIQQLNSVTTTYLPTLRNASFISTIPRLNTTLTHCASTSTFTPLTNLQTNYQTTLAYVNATVIGGYNGLQALINGIMSNISKVASDLNTFTSGYCDNNNAKVCNANQLCDGVGNCINQGTKRCANTPTTFCNYTSQCPAGDRCLVDATTYAPLLLSLQSFWNVAPP